MERLFRLPEMKKVPNNCYLSAYCVFNRKGKLLLIGTNRLWQLTRAGYISMWQTFCIGKRESYWWRYECDVGGWDCFPFIPLCCSTLAFSHIFIFFYAFLSQLSHVVGLMSSLPLYYIYLVLSDFGPLGCHSSIYSTNHFNFQGINQ